MLDKRHQSRSENSVLPAEVESWRVLLEEVDESVWSADENIWKRNIRVKLGG